MSSPGTPYKSTPQLPDPSPQGRYVWIRNWWPIILLATATGAFVARSFLPKEVSRWYIAASLEQRSRGDTIGAIENLREATKWNPNAKVEYQREWRRQHSTDNERVIIKANFYRHHGFTQYELGLKDEAIESVKRSVMIMRSQYGTSLNTLAYLQALKDQDLDQALKNVEESIVLEGANVANLDTRGFIRFKRQEHRSAKDDLDAAVKLAEELVEQAKSGPKTGTRGSEMDLPAAQGTLAVLLYHRAQILKALSQDDEAEADTKRIRQLGVEPSEDLY